MKSNLLKIASFSAVVLGSFAIPSQAEVIVVNRGHWHRGYYVAPRAVYVAPRPVVVVHPTYVRVW